MGKFIRELHELATHVKNMILAGQDIPMNTDFMEMLERSAINGTGVPSVIMNYINEADYAKTLVMANAKFLGRVISSQLNFNDGATELYKKVMHHTTNIKPEIISKFVFTFNPPRTLNNVNMGDLINNTDQTVNYMVDAISGKNATPSDEQLAIKDKVYKKVAKEMLPMLPWKRVDEMIEEAKMELQQDKLDNPKTEGQ
jgi:hypothetical protein